MSKRITVLVRDDAQLARIENLARRVGLDRGPLVRLLAGVGLDVAEQDPARLVRPKEKA